MGKGGIRRADNALGRFYTAEVSQMNTMTLREQLYRQIDTLPDEIVEQIADFALFVMARRQIAPLYEDWGRDQWQRFALDQLFREDDEVVYSLADAQEVYKP